MSHGARHERRTVAAQACGFAIVALATIACSEAQSIPVTIRIDDAEPWHVHSPGRAFKLRVEVSAHRVDGGRVFAQWVADDGRALSTKIEVVPGRRRTLTSPGGAAGYYGLVFTSDDPRISFPPQNPGFPSDEYGFAVAPRPAQRAASPSSRFGTVHSDVRVGRDWDPWLRGTHTKTLTWNTLSPPDWRRAIRQRSRAGRIELPLLSGRGWDSDDAEPIDAGAVAALAERFGDYARIEPRTRDWELGIEENIDGRYFEAPDYFANLASKIEAVRAVADRVDSSIRFVYNAVGFEYRDHAKLFASKAFDGIQVFSTHPYRWTDFESPEGWLADHLRRLRRMLDASGHDKVPIWITEIGIPVRGNRDPRGFFGYPDDGNRVPGASRSYAARYLIKCHAIALSERVGRIYTYNYQNRGNAIDRAEDWFGLRSYAAAGPGYPLPAYVAYITLLRELRGRPFAAVRRLDNGVVAYEFGTGDVRKLLAWIHPDAQRDVPIARLAAGFDRSRVTRATTLYGTPIRTAGRTLRLTGEPVWLTLRR